MDMYRELVAVQRRLSVLEGAPTDPASLKTRALAALMERAVGALNLNLEAPHAARSRCLCSAVLFGLSLTFLCSYARVASSSLQTVLVDRRQTETVGF